MNIKIKLMSNNPFSKLPNPSSHPDPRTISVSDFQKYHSHEMAKFQTNLRVFKRSLPYIGGCIGLSLFFAFFADKAAKSDLFGGDNRGGSYLNMTTIYDEDHYAYNRQFQRVHVLGESKLADSSKHSRQLLADLGVNLPNLGAPHIPKRAPHEKFY